MNAFFKDIRTIERMQQGSLGCYVAQFAARLHTDGYTRQTGRVMLAIVAGFNRWLKRKHIATGQINSDQAEKYLQFRRRGTSQPYTTGRATLTRWLSLLREQGVIPEPPSPMITPIDRVIERYDNYLEKERVLSWRTRITYRPLVLQLLVSKFSSGPVDLSQLCASDVIKYVQRGAKRLSSSGMQTLAAAIRSFLQFARYQGDVTLDLAACVPSVASWSLSTLPKSLPAEAVKQALAHCPRKTAVGRRDYAILLLLARLGLRAGEVVSLTLEDVGWEASCITIRGKMNRVDQLPLPADVGEAIASYLKHDRPRSVNTRRLFVVAKAPLSGFKDSSAIYCIVKAALARAGIDSPQKGPHQFRHTLACEMLRQGRSLKEIGDILRHQSPNTTAIYAKVDLLALRPLALAWPGGGP